MLFNSIELTLFILPGIGKPAGLDGKTWGHYQD